MSKQDKIHGFAGGTGASLKVWLGQTQSDNYLESRWKLDQRLCSPQLSLTLSLPWPPTRSFDRLQTWVTPKPPYKHQPLRSQTALTMTSCEYPTSRYSWMGVSWGLPPIHLLNSDIICTRLRIRVNIKKIRGLQMKGAVFRSSEFPAGKKKKRIADVIPATYVRQARCLGSCTGVWESRAVQLNSIVLMLTTFFICLYSVLKNMSGNMSGFSSLWCHKKRQKNVFIQWQVGVARTWNTPSLLTSNI